MKYKKTLRWEVKENTFEESKKYSSRTEFHDKSHGAYTVAKRNGWLDEMYWLNRKNVYTDKVDTVYKYHFANEKAVYVGRTIYPKLRDIQHRTRENDTVLKFAIEHDVEIPKMEIIEDNLTVTEGVEKEKYWAKYYKENGLILINRQPCGSLGYMAKGKWSKRKCFEEAKRYRTRSEFQRNASQAYFLSRKNGWLDEMEWMPKKEFHPKGYWTVRENIIQEGNKYVTLKDFQEKSSGAFNAARRLGIINEMTWLKKKERLPNYFWKNKEHVMNEARKYSSRTEFSKGNQSAYWAAHKYGYIDEIDWFKRK